MNCQIYSIYYSNGIKKLYCHSTSQILILYFLLISRSAMDLQPPTASGGGRSGRSLGTWEPWNHGTIQHLGIGDLTWLTCATCAKRREWGNDPQEVWIKNPATISNPNSHPFPTLSSSKLMGLEKSEISMDLTRFHSTTIVWRWSANRIWPYPKEVTGNRCPLHPGTSMRKPWKKSRSCSFETS
jgi:hypothetical protein